MSCYILAADTVVALAQGNQQLVTVVKKRLKHTRVYLSVTVYLQARMKITKLAAGLPHGMGARIAKRLDDICNEYIQFLEQGGERDAVWPEGHGAHNLPHVIEWLFFTRHAALKAGQLWEADFGRGTTPHDVAPLLLAAQAKEWQARVVTSYPGDLGRYDVDTEDWLMEGELQDLPDEDESEEESAAGM